MSARQGEPKYRASGFVRTRPQLAAMSIDDGPADRQAHPDAARLCRVESRENALEMFRINARPGIAHGHQKATCLGSRGADRQLSYPCLDRAHCLDRIEDQVQDDLLQLNAIP